MSHMPKQPTQKQSMAAAVLAAVVVTTGCQCAALLPPGPMNQQQARAVVHDPFPQNDIGPEDLSSRPPDYQQPLPLPVRNRIGPDAIPGLGR